MSATVYIVGMESLDQGPEASPRPEACFTTRDAAEAWGRLYGEPLIGRTYWWGTVRDVTQTYEIWELQVIDANGAGA